MAGAAVKGGAECVKPNAFGLGDGTRYNLTAMNEDQVNQLFEYKHVASAEEIPELFKQFEM